MKLVLYPFNMPGIFVQVFVAESPVILKDQVLANILTDSVVSETPI